MASMPASPQITEQNAPFFHLTDDEALTARPHGRGALTMTRGLAHAAGTDAGNRSMRTAGRTQWNDDDFNVAAEMTMRLTVLSGFLPPECYEQCVGRPFPYVCGNDGSWISLRADAAEAI